MSTDTESEIDGLGATYFSKFVRATSWHGAVLASMAGQGLELGKVGHARDGMMVWRMLSLFSIHDMLFFGVAGPEVGWAGVPGLYVRPCSQTSTFDRGSWLANFMAVPFDLRLFNPSYRTASLSMLCAARKNGSLAVDRSHEYLTCVGSRCRHDSRCKVFQVSTL